MLDIDPHDANSSIQNQHDTEYASLDKIKEANEMMERTITNTFQGSRP